MIHTENMEFGYGKESVFEDISFKLERNDFLAIMGSNGAGKSTMLKCLDKILPLRKGRIFFENCLPTDIAAEKLSQHMAYVSQFSETSRVTVYEAVLLGRFPYIKWNLCQEDYQIVEDVLYKMHLEELSLRYIDELSGGELQKIVIARALAQQPEVILLDEPTNNLDLKNQIEVLNLIFQIARDNKIAVIAVLHDLNMSLRYANKFMFLKDKKIAAYGGKEIMTNDIISNIYGLPVAVEKIHGQQIVVPL